MTAQNKKHLKIAGLILAIGALLALAWYFFWPRLDMKAVKENISDFAKDYPDPVAVEFILLQGVHEIRWHRPSYLQAKKVAETSNLPIERVITDAAVNQAHEYGYL